MHSSRKRVCLIAPEFIGPFPNGGVGTACYWEATTLAAAGYDVTVLYTGPTERETPQHWQQVYADGPFAYVDLWDAAAAGKFPATGAIQQPCAEAHTGELVFRYLRDQSFDLLLFQEFLGHGARTLQARRSGEALASTPAAVTLHSCRQWIYEGMKRLPASRADLYVDFLERESARLADYVIAPSRHMAEWAAAHWRMAQAAVIPYCYDRSIEQPAARVRHEGPFTQLVFFGRLETRKGLHVFCRALENAAARGPVQKITFLGKTSTVEGRPSEEFIRATLAGLEGVAIEIISDLGSLEALDWLEHQRHTIVVAPSLVDNLPYAVIELFARRLPLLASHIGGIPEIVGRGNAHVLAEPAPRDLGGLLARTHQEGHLTIDYRAGYSIEAANAAHLAHVARMIDEFVPPRVSHPPACTIVVVDGGDDMLEEARRRFVAAEPAAARLVFRTWADWRARCETHPALFVSSAVVPRPNMIGRLLRALGDERVAAVTSSFECGSAEVAPLGASLEAGWTNNVFGGPCFAASAAAATVLRENVGSAFEFWPAYAAIACAGLDIALVPGVLFASPAPEVDSPQALERVARQYDLLAPERLDLGWLLKYASRVERSGAGATSTPGVSPGRDLYDHLLAVPDSRIQLYAGLTWTPGEDPYVAEIKRLRKRLSVIAEHWQGTDPRVYIYGAGEHSRLVLTLEPELGRFVAGFIDRRPVAEFLGKPCIRPEQLTPAIADAVLYSSREFEKDMHNRLSTVPVDHVLLYAESSDGAPATTASRLRRRFGHDSADAEGLQALQQRRPSWVEGGISGGDAEFLLELVSGVRPRSVLEIGVASGASSAALLFALDALHGSEPRVLHSCDVRGTCYFDVSRGTGSAVDEMYSQRRTRWMLDTASDARRISQALPPGSMDLTFIDANHSHPWPLLDLLHVTEAARPGSWIALHDIELPKLHPQYQVHGPQWLFQAWPFNKVHGIGGSINIGAVQLPTDLRDLIPVALALLERPWEHTPTSWHVALPGVFKEVSKALKPRLPDPARAA